jgi:hypothetical protein
LIISLLLLALEVAAAAVRGNTTSLEVHRRHLRSMAAAVAAARGISACKIFMWGMLVAFLLASALAESEQVPNQ